MTKNMDFTAKPAPATPIDTDAIMQTLPMPSDVMFAQRLSPQEKKYLEETGWPDQSHIPGNLQELTDETKTAVIADYVRRHGEESDDEIIAEVQKRAAGQIAKYRTIPLENLPAEAQDAYKKILADMAADVRLNAEREKKAAEGTGSMTQSVAAAIHDIRMKVADPQENTPNHIGNVIAEPARPAEPEETVSAEPARPPEAATEKPVAPPTPMSVRAPIPPPTEAEISLFFAAILAGQEYTKTYKRMNGNLEIQFRSLAVSEVDAIQAQVSKEFVDDTVSDAATKGNNYVNSFLRYRTVLQLVKISTGQGLKATFPSSLSGWGAPHIDPKKPPLPQIQKVVLGVVDRNQYLFNIISQTHERFMEHTTQLLQKVQEENF